MKKRNDKVTSTCVYELRQINLVVSSNITSQPMQLVASSPLDYSISRRRLLRSSEYKTPLLAPL